MRDGGEELVFLLLDAEALALGLLPLCNVHHGADHARQSTRVIDVRSSATGQPVQRAVGPHHAVHHLEVATLFRGTTDRLGHCGPVVRMDKAHERFERAIERSRAQTEQRFHFLRPRDVATDRIPIPGAHAARLECLAQAVCHFSADTRLLDVRRHTCEQLTCSEGLDQVIVGARLEALDAGFLARSRGQQHERHFASARLGTQRAQQAESVQARHHDVRQHQVGRVRQRALERKDAVRHRLHVVAIAE